jgi:hypothetical protein
MEKAAETQILLSQRAEENRECPESQAKLIILFFTLLDCVKLMLLIK